MDNIEKNINNNIDHIKKIYFWRTAFFGVVILIAGIAIGGASMSILSEQRLANSPPTNVSNNLMPRLRQTLGLTQEQVNIIRPILDGHLQKLLQIRENARVDIFNTLEQMGKEINPVLGERQKRVWQQELIRIQRDFSPAPLRTGTGAGGNRRGTGAGAKPGQGQRRYGNVRGQQQYQRSIIQQRRGMEPLSSPNVPNTFNNDVNEVQTNIKESIDPNHME